MWQLFLGSLLLGLIHPLFPNHWIPLIAISKAEKWTNKETIAATLITGFSHTLSTIIIGIIVGFVGIKLSENYSYITRVAAPLILVILGVVYLLLDLRLSHHHNHFEINNESLKNRKSKTAIILTLCIGLFFSPCIEIEAYYFQAATQGWIGIFLVSVIYLIMTLTIMVTLVYLGLKGLNKFNLHFLDHHEKAITGVVLILLGLLAYFVEF
jgi:nickel/cobalt transporter (NicO) family protein